MFVAFELFSSVIVFVQINRLIYEVYPILKSIKISGSRFLLKVYYGSLLPFVLLKILVALFLVLEESSICEAMHESLYDVKCC